MSLRRGQQGFSLIELMIAMTLGLVMIGAASLMMLSNRSTFLAVDSSSRIQENARFALGIIAENIRMAGYYDAEISGPSNFMLGDACGPFDPCTANGVGTASDRIGIISNPPAGNEQDCIGGITADDDTYVNAYFIGDADSDGVFSLYCGSLNQATGAVNNAQPLVDGIDNMQLQYGVLNSDDVVSYVSADRVTDWGALRSVRVTLLVSDGQPNGSAEQVTRSYDLLDAGTIAYTDKYQRQLFTTTVVINNAF
jgi:type IV pilus assembly protein PilW